MDTGTSNKNGDSKTYNQNLDKKNTLDKGNDTNVGINNPTNLDRKISSDKISFINNGNLEKKNSKNINKQTTFSDNQGNLENKSTLNNIGRINSIDDEETKSKTNANKFEKQATGTSFSKKKSNTIDLLNNPNYIDKQNKNVQYTNPIQEEDDPLDENKLEASNEENYYDTNDNLKDDEPVTLRIDQNPHNRTISSKISNTNTNKYSVEYSIYKPYVKYEGTTKTEKNIICWSCDSVLIVSPESNIVQCSVCEKLNKVPENAPDTNNMFSPSRMQQNNVNHFDINVPFVFVCVTCPYCQTENKVNKGTQHMVCYKCYKSVNVVGGKNRQSGVHNQRVNNQLQQKSLRFSDVSFQDPMFYQGFYPNYGNLPYFPQPQYYQPFMNPYATPGYYPPILDYNRRSMHNYKSRETNLNERYKSNNSPLKEKLKKIRNELDSDEPPKSLNSPYSKPYNNIADNRIGKNDGVYKSMFSPQIKR
jgi:hypothetical protein